MNRKPLILLLAILGGCTPMNKVDFSEIDTSCNLSIIQGEINGKKTFFLIDTGAGITTLDINQAKQFGFDYSYTDIQIAGITNDVAEINLATGIKSLKVNGMEISEERIYTSNLRKLIAFVEQCARKRISGIIGVPVIRRYGLVIDLPNNKVYKYTPQH